MVKTEVVSFRAGRQERIRLGAMARRSFEQAGVEVNTKNRDQVSLFMGSIARGLLEGKIQFDPAVLFRTQKKAA